LVKRELEKRSNSQAAWRPKLHKKKLDLEIPQNFIVKLPAKAEPGNRPVKPKQDIGTSFSVLSSALIMGPVWPSSLNIWIPVVKTN